MNNANPFYQVDTLLKRCVEEWGEDSQIDMAIEECSELVMALCKARRNINEQTFSCVCEEIADVEIMMQQLRIIFDTDKVDKFREEKLKRLRERLETREAG